MNNSKLNQVDNLRPYILAMMRSEGRNFTVCEYCHKGIPDGLYELHHTKYNGATYKDIMIVCRSCNRIGINKGLF